MKRIQRYRQELHKRAELDMHLPKTISYLKEQLKGLPCEIIEVIPSSLCVYFNANKEYTVAFRSDMDALPIEEDESHTIVSMQKGVMHACGHDGHMAMLLETAQRIVKYYKSLTCNVLLIFQPGEERCAGAKRLCEKHILKTYHVKAIFGLHLMPKIEKGKIAGKPGPMMAGSHEITIDIKGKGVHTAQYLKGKDALECAASFLMNIYGRINLSHVLCRINYMKSGTTCNIVSNFSHMKGTIRYFDKNMLDLYLNKLNQIKIEMEKRYGTSIKIELSDGYPPLCNDQTICQNIFRLNNPLLYQLEEPYYTSEDFSYYLQECPGAFFFLGLGDTAPLHSKTFDFDESVLDNGVEFYEWILQHKDEIC